MMQQFRVEGRFVFIVTAEDADDAEAAVVTIADHDVPHVKHVQTIEVHDVVWDERQDDHG